MVRLIPSLLRESAQSSAMDGSASGKNTQISLLYREASRAMARVKLKKGEQEKWEKNHVLLENRTNFKDADK